MRSSHSTADEFNPENSSESKDQNAFLAAENKALNEQNERLISENKDLRKKLKEQEKEINELKINLNLSRQFNPNLNSSGFFSLNLLPKPDEIVGEKISAACIQNEILPWICKEIEKMEDLLKILQSDFKSHIEADKNNKIILKGKVIKKIPLIYPVLIDASGNQSEAYFTRDTCILINDRLTKQFQLKNVLGRSTNDKRNYFINISISALIELNELRKESENTLNNSVATHSDNTENKNEDQNPANNQTMKM